MGSEGRRAARVIQERSISTRAALLEGAARVFSRMTYAEARLKDVSDEAGVSQGSLYFHFGNKADIAGAVLQVQQERMTSVLAEVRGRAEKGLDVLLSLIDNLAVMVAADVVVQAGIKLGMQPGTGLELEAKGPYFEWIEIAADLIRQGVEDRSISPAVDVNSAAEYLNVVFVGSQVLSELQDSWQSFPDRVQRMRPHIIAVLGGDSAG
ncbi:MAG TPA: ScbR family autoregulator-binding transcription factor [Terrimesophilobacter sp.]|nr:ScbR family autoregulator-binding transcription factor [Terrimesophilobacter sp.]